MKSILLLSLLLTACGTEPYKEYAQDSRPNVTCIGDSIMIGHCTVLSYKAKNIFNVKRITQSADPATGVDNARNTAYTLASLDTWLKYYPNNKVIIWNNGTWNASNGFTPGTDPRWGGTSVEQYEREIKLIAAKLLKAAPRVIFLTTTQMTADETRSATGRNIQLNEIAKRVLPAIGIEVRDLWDFTIDHQDWHMANNDLHFNPFGNEYIADWIYSFLRGLK